MTELRIRVKEVIKDKLEQLKEKTGLSMNYYVNYAIVKQLIMDKLLLHWEYMDITDIKPQYEDIVKYPDEAQELNKFCDGDSCEIYPKKNPDWNPTDPESDRFIRGEKC